MATPKRTLSNAVDRAIRQAGGVVALANLLGVNQNVVSNWRLRGCIPAGRCMAIEVALNGSLTCRDMRPDVFSPPIEKVA